MVKLADRVEDVVIDEVGVQRDSGCRAGTGGGDDLGSRVDDVAGRPDSRDAGASRAVDARPAVGVDVDVAAQAHEQCAVRDEAGRHEQRVAGHDRAIVHLDAAQVVGVVSVAGKLPMFPLSVTDSLHPCGAVELSAAG